MYTNMIQCTDPDIIMGTESWLNSTILDGEIFPEIMKKNMFFW